MSSSLPILKKALRTLAGSFVAFVCIVVISIVTTVVTLAYIKLDSRGMLPHSISMGGWNFNKKGPAQQNIPPEKFEVVPKRDRFEI